MEQVTIQEALDFCLENPEGLSHEELLARFPGYRVELASLLGLATGVKSLSVPSVPADRREAMKARLMSAAAAQPSQSWEVDTVSVAPAAMAVPAVPVAPVQAEQPSSMDLQPRPRRALPWYLSPGWIVAAAAILLVVFTWWSSARSLPDSPFYGIKLASENIALNLAGSDADKAQENINLANSRLYDLRTMEQRGNLAASQAAFDSYASHLQNSSAIWERLKGQTQTAVAEVLYASSIAGEVTFDSFGAQANSLPTTLRQEITNTQVELSGVSSDTARALTVANINPNSVFGSVDSNISPLLTPVASVPAAVPTGTLTVPVGAVSPTMVATGPTSAPRPPVVPATPTGVVSQPSPNPTVTIVPPVAATSTPGQIAIDTPMPTATFTTAPATATPVVISTNTPPAELTATTTPTEPVPTEIPATAEPTDTPVPPIVSTPTPTTEPIIPTNTPAPVASPTSTQVPPAPTSTPVPPSATPVPQANVCDLQISPRIAASCASANSVSWSATVTNPGPGVVHATYKAELQVTMRGGGGFVSVKSVSGSRDFSVGDTGVAGTIGYTFPANALQWKIKFSIDTSGYSCTVSSHQSNPMPACH